VFLNRRDFSTGVLAFGALGGGLPAQAQRIPREGAEYRTLSRPVAMQAGAGRLEVIEFFWYSCPHCNSFEPMLENWARGLPADVVLSRVPVGFRPDFQPQQRLFYTLEAMDLLPRLHAKVYHAIHAERVPLNRDDSILAWIEKQDVDRARFQETYASPYVSSKVRQALQLQEAFAVEGVPSMGIAGRWYTDGSLAGNMPRVLQVTDYLLAQARENSRR
jgi:protein dithiol oxidoreductase (disulfide-forming)